MSFAPSDVLSTIGDIASIFGLCVTLYLTRTALQVRREFQRLILLPPAIEAFTQHCTALTLLMQPGTPHPELGKLLGVVEGTLNSLRRYLDKDDRKAVRVVLDILRDSGQHPSADALARLHTQMWRLSTELTATLERIQWNR